MQWKSASENVVTAQQCLESYYIFCKYLLVTLSQLLYCQEHLLDFLTSLSWLKSFFSGCSSEWTDCKPFVRACSPLMRSTSSFWLLVTVKKRSWEYWMSVWRSRQQNRNHIFFLVQSLQSESLEFTRATYQNESDPGMAAVMRAETSWD